MNEIVKEIEVVSSCIGDWYSKYIGQKFAVIDPTWWSLAEGDCYYVEHPENDENTVFYVLKNDCKVTKSVAQSAPETTEILNEVKADKGILTEEELRHREMNFQTDYMGSIITDRSFKYVQEIINSHRLLLAANAELSFKNMKIPTLEADNKLLEETCEELEHKLSVQNEEICRLKDEISRLKGENNHE